MIIPSYNATEQCMLQIDSKIQMAHRDKAVHCWLNYYRPLVQKRLASLNRGEMLSTLAVNISCLCIYHGYDSTSYVGMTMTSNKNGSHIKSAQMTRSKCLH